MSAYIVDFTYTSFMNDQINCFAMIFYIQPVADVQSLAVNRQMYSKDTGKDQMLMTMERALTSGQKAGFFFLGFLGGIVGILAASLMNINAPYRPEGTKMAALGFATACVLGTLIALVGFIALLGAR